jgi:hypothetical protein
MVMKKIRDQIFVGDTLNENLVINHLIWLLINGSQLKLGIIIY